MASSGAGSPRRTSKGKILIVDDEEAMRDLLKAILESDYHVAEADSGVALHRALDQDQPDVILLDMKLPDANGLGLLPAIKQRWPATQVIVLSGAPTDAAAAPWTTDALNRGAFSFFSKSAGFDFQKLLDGVSLALQCRHQTHPTTPMPPSQGLSSLHP
jgi:DNA-binding NtrC family response regulator